jgi:hypothetical protein
MSACEMRRCGPPFRGCPSGPIAVMGSMPGIPCWNMLGGGMGIPTGAGMPPGAGIPTGGMWPKKAPCSGAKA